MAIRRVTLARMLLLKNHQSDEHETMMKNDQLDQLSSKMQCNTRENECKVSIFMD